MSTLAIVEHVDVVRDRGDCRGTRGPRGLREFGLQGPETTPATPIGADTSFGSREPATVVLRP